MTDLSLEGREGLPDALRVLARAIPRGDWEGHANFTALTRFWLDRHMMFRDVLGRMVSDGQGLLDGRIAPERHMCETQRLAGFLMNELMAHHHIEDAHYFPQLIGLDPRISAGFEVLDADHVALDGHIRSTVEDVNAYLRAGDRTAAGRLHENLNRFDRFIDRHLTDEEDLVVPVILTYAPNLG